MKKFCFQEYQLANNDRYRMWFEVEGRTLDTLSVTIYRENKKTGAVSNTPSIFVIYEDTKTNMEYINYLGLNILSSNYEKSSMEIAFFQ